MTDFSHPHDHDQQERHDSQEHIDHGGIGKYLLVFAALIVLTGFSFLTYFDFWRENVPVKASRALMMAVSCTKAMLVIMFFMHMLWEANWKWVLTIPATFMSVFLTLMLVPDIGMRQNNGYARYSYERLIFAPDPDVVEHEEAKEAEEAMQHEGEH
jgi:cytochrome c oxidase subunit IV